MSDTDTRDDESQADAFANVRWEASMFLQEAALAVLKGDDKRCAALRLSAESLCELAAREPRSDEQNG